ncbi:MAG TPA: BTAD domain-containing putative transcriptional regulator, partial [Anaerolineales bacterium]|nr:BTAD domain-containing putative transcriptional regulator [Anaerolineales bacterium]
MFDLRLLGSFELAQTEGEAPVRLGAKPQALLAYLAMSAGKSVPRGRLAGLLWGERDEENARHSLSQALSTIRGALGPDGNYLIQAAVDGIRLEEANIDVDAKSFERLANSKEQAKLLQARELYRGELLQGLDISERDFEEWMLGERYRLAEIAATAFSRLLDLQISTKDYEEAVDTARDLIAVTPLEEAAHARLITLYGALNRRGLAESHYNRCRELFRRELDRDPGKEIEDAIKSAREYEPGIDLDPTSNQLFSERRLTTILAADIVGYSRMMAEDEAGTLASIKDLRSRLIDPKVTLYRGRVVKLMGDGALMEFGSVVDAVNFAIDVQTTTIDQNRDMPDEQQISFRIGINVGDIIVDGEDIYGDGVNIAARLEGLAEPGGICVSGTVYDHVHGKVGADFDDLGEQHVKNIPKPVQAYKIVLDSPSSKPGLRPWIRRASTGPNWTVIAGLIVVLIVFAGFSQWLLLRPPHDMQLSETNSALPIPDKPSIAVLPFDNISGDPNQEYFSDGITNELITDLSRVSGLFVIASNTSFTYDGQAVSVSDVGHDLGVRFVLEGSVQKASERVRISARLIDATTGFQVWADQYDRKLNDVFSLQDEVVSEIISALKVKLSPRERVALARKDTNSLEAYDYFLRGYEILRSSPQDVARIRVMFER